MNTKSSRKLGHSLHSHESQWLGFNNVLTSKRTITETGNPLCNEGYLSQSQSFSRAYFSFWYSSGRFSSLHVDQKPRIKSQLWVINVSALTNLTIQSRRLCLCFSDQYLQVIKPLTAHCIWTMLDTVSHVQKILPEQTSNLEYECAISTKVWALEPFREGEKEEVVTASRN